MLVSLSQLDTNFSHLGGGSLTWELPQSDWSVGIAVGIFLSNDWCEEIHTAVGSTVSGQMSQVYIREVTEQAKGSKPALLPGCCLRFPASAFLPQRSCLDFLTCFSSLMDGLCVSGGWNKPFYPQASFGPKFITGAEKQARVGIRTRVGSFWDRPDHVVFRESYRRVWELWAGKTVECWKLNELLWELGRQCVGRSAGEGGLACKVSEGTKNSIQGCLWYIWIKTLWMWSLHITGTTNAVINKTSITEVKSSRTCFLRVSAQKLWSGIWQERKGYTSNWQPNLVMYKSVPAWLYTAGWFTSEARGWRLKHT